MHVDIGDSAIAAATRARDALSPPALGASERSMARLTTRAVFCEALLGAIRAQVAEVRTAAK